MSRKIVIKPVLPLAAASPRSRKAGVKIGAVATRRTTVAGGTDPALDARLDELLHRAQTLSSSADRLLSRLA